jgi:RHS repeat-associated protein
LDFCHNLPSRADESFSYDANGNRTNPGYVTGKNNRLLSDGKFNYEYDDEGNVITQTDILTGEVTGYTWDYRNRLTQITERNTAGTVINQSNQTYDPNDLRIGKTANGTTERYVYAQNQNIGLKFDGSGALTNRYLYGNSIDAILADESNGSTLWTFTDHQNSVRDLGDDSGAVRNHLTYSAFGELTSQSDPSVATQFGYTGREFEPATGIQYNRGRFYAPFTGKFLSPDPIGFSGGDPNLYRYVKNSPVGAIDPSGNVKIEIVHNPIERQRGILRINAPSLTILGGLRQKVEFSVVYDVFVSHAFILVTDDRKKCIPPDTNQTYYRGGPLVQDVWQQIKYGDSGPIVTESGKYEPRTIDYPSTPAKAAQQKKIVVYNKPGEPIDKYDSKFNQTLTRIQDGNFKYFLPGPNSNTVAHQLLKDAGLPAPLPFEEAKYPPYIHIGRPPGWEYDFWKNSLPRYNRSSNIPYSNLLPGFDNNLNPGNCST